MSLVLTELSDAGIVMVADSVISFDEDGEPSPRRNPEQWDKILKVPNIHAGISYWGAIGHITPDRFDRWLSRKIGEANYPDLPTFADYLAHVLNEAAGNRLINANQAAGVHVAGFHTWQDGLKKPTFYHVHNGHLTTQATVKTPTETTVISTGTVASTYDTHSLNSPQVDPRIQVDPLILAAQQPGAVLDYAPNAAPRERFKAHPDFAPESLTPDQAAERLHIGYLTRNGDYMPYTIITDGLNSIRLALNSIPGIRVPRDPAAIGSRLGFLRLLMQTVIEIYGCSNFRKVIGRPITSLAIRHDGYYQEANNAGTSATP